MDTLRVLCLSGGCGGLLAGLCLRAIEISHSTWNLFLEFRSGRRELSAAADLRLCLISALVAFGSMVFWAMELYAILTKASAG